MDNRSDTLEKQIKHTRELKDFLQMMSTFVNSIYWRLIALLLSAKVSRRVYLQSF